MKTYKQLPLYWKCQLAGWSVAALYWWFMGFIGTDFSWVLSIIHFAADLFIYILISHLYRNFSRRYGWHQLSIQQLALRLIPAIILLGLAFMVLTIYKNHLVRYFFEYGFNDSIAEQFNMRGLTTFVTGVRLMSIWILAYYGYHFAQREINAVKESSRLSMIAKDAAFNNLSAQLNPHFFFNALNSIKALAAENPQATRRAIDLLSDLLRTSLYGRDTGLITVKAEMELVNDYLELEKIRFEERLQTHIEMDERIKDHYTLPLSIQVLVENAIKHGIAKSRKGGTVHIRVVQEEQYLVVMVQNPGQLEAAASQGVGIRNLKERLQLQFGGSASFEIRQHDTGTVEAVIKIPQNG